MTTQESFKKRVRARMAKTGEKYNAARRALIEQASQHPGIEPTVGGRVWAAQPEHSDEAVREATGRGWDAWVDLIEAGPVTDEGHTAVAAWLQDVHDVEGWWAQSVTGGWERITGRRLPHQMPDGTFTANRSQTIAGLDREAVRALLLDEDGRAVLFPGHDVELRSRPTSKSLRFGMGGGVALIDVAARDDDRTVVTVSHEKLPSFDDVALWKDFWGDWLDALAAGVDA